MSPPNSTPLPLNPWGIVNLRNGASGGLPSGLANGSVKAWLDIPAKQSNSTRSNIYQSLNKMSYPISNLAWPHPVKTLVTKDVARTWGNDCRLTRKYDGVFAVREVAGYTLLGEIVRPKSGGMFTASDQALMAECGEFFAAFDCVGCFGCSIAHESTHTRVSRLNLLPDWPAEFGCVIAETVTDIDDVLAAGGEGIVRQEWRAPYGQITACKRGEIYLCQVTEAPGQSQSAKVRILAAESGDRAGIIDGVTTSVRFGGGKADRIHVGSIVRVESVGLTSVGKIREGKLASEWLVKQ